MTFLKPSLAVLTVAGLVLALPASDTFAHSHTKAPATHHVLAAAGKKTVSKTVKTKATTTKKHVTVSTKKTATHAKAHKAGA